MITSSKSPGGELIHFGRFVDQQFEDTDANVLAAVQEIADFLKPYAGRMIFMRKPLTIVRGYKCFDSDKVLASVLIRGTILMCDTEDHLEVMTGVQRFVDLPA